MSGEKTNDDLFNMMLKRNAQAAEARRLYRRPENEPSRGFLICIPLKPDEIDLRYQQAKYYVCSGNARSDKCFFFTAFMLEELLSYLAASIPIDELQILCHGDENGNILFPFTMEEGQPINKRNPVSPSLISTQVPTRANSSGFKQHIWIHCYGHRSRSADDAVMNYQLRTQVSHVTSEMIPFSFNIPRLFADGSNAGSVHSGLNPEIMYQPGVSEFLKLAGIRKNLKIKLSQLREKASTMAQLLTDFPNASNASSWLAQKNITSQQILVVQQKLESVGLQLDNLCDYVKKSFLPK